MVIVHSATAHDFDHPSSSRLDMPIEDHALAAPDRTDLNVERRATSDAADPPRREEP